MSLGIRSKNTDSKNAAQGYYHKADIWGDFAVAASKMVEYTRDSTFDFNSKIHNYSTFGSFCGLILCRRENKRTTNKINDVS